MTVQHIGSKTCYNSCEVPDSNPIAIKSIKV
jgi:hypothetical protein